MFIFALSKFPKKLQLDRAQCNTQTASVVMVSTRNGAQKWALLADTDYLNPTPTRALLTLN